MRICGNMNRFVIKPFLAAVILCGTVGASAADFSYGGIYYDITSDTEMTCSVASPDDGTNYTGDIVIPETVAYQGNTYRVTEIGWNAFRDCSVSSVELPGSIETIRVAAFSGCTNMRGFTVPASVTSIESLALDNCSGLRTLTFEDGTEPLLMGSNFSSDNGQTGLFHDALVTTIYLGRDIDYDDEISFQYEKPFVDMEELREVTIGETVTKIGDDLFNHCVSLSRVNFAENGNLRSIGARAFALNYVLPAIEIPEGVTEVGGSAFMYCTELSSVSLPSTLTSLGEGVFFMCSNIDRIEIPDGVTEIKDDTFSACGKLTAVALPEGLTTVGDKAFYSCASLSDINFPKSLTSIGAGAFNGCVGITSINISDNVATIGEEAFYGCTGLTAVVIGNSVKELPASLFYGCSNIESVTVGSGVGKICGWVFSGCNKLREVVIEDGAESIELGYNVGDRYSGSQYALFDGCPVETFYMGRDIKYEEPAYYGREYICPFDGNTTLRTVTVGNNVTAIPEKLFENCATLESVTIGGSVAAIGGKAFDGCVSLKEVRISDVGAWCMMDFAELSSNPLYYAHNMYLNGALLQNADIPSGTAVVKDYAFAGGTCLTGISVPASVTSLGYQSFRDCANISSVTIADGATPLAVGYDLFAEGGNGAGLFAASKNIGSVYLGRDLTYEADAAYGYSPFYGTGVADLQFGAGITQIGGYLFKDCPVASPIDLPTAVKVIGEYAFDGAQTESVTIPASVETIYQGAFNNCTQLSSLTIEDSETTLNMLERGKVTEDYDKPMFFNGSKVGAVYVGRPVYYETALSGDGAPFLGTTGLTDATIGGYMTEVPELMFFKCSSLVNVNLSESVTLIDDMAFCNCTALKEVTIPANVSYAAYGFDGCSALEKIIVEDGTVTVDIGRIIENKNVKELYLGRNLFISMSTGFSPMEKLTLGKMVDRLKNSYFYGATNLREIYSENTVPPVAFEDYGMYYFADATYENAVLYIPKGSLEAYRTADTWRKFANIVEYFNADGGVADVAGEGVSVTVSDGNITINGVGDDAVVEVYNIAGQRVYSGAVKPVALDRGLYIVRVAGSTFKVAL